ncbi:hypothetical protein BXY70_2407 [Roseovarius halotolerans]|uniref:NADH dehydrogenase subunit E n=1 Tax=Roseovarius halotolerans TaxID=505353 RepID=A0A1X6Z9E7_9RHOB|nr:hypothetical protein [Roseovarius halotolerans]RKT30418.1 hypothetical protein BXY70_2407 [Roseovarius halotolerans]SLN44189.1 hypothetical protein ROH8110_02304 [Roseovarius halotolerans]
MKRMMAAASAGLVLTLGACIAPPEGVNPEDVQEYKLAAASIGCEMATEADFQPVELQAGLTREQSTGITSYLLSKGEAERLPGGGVKLTTGACS